jgi:hypothetical protein
MDPHQTQTLQKKTKTMPSYKAKISKNTKKGVTTKNRDHQKMSPCGNGIIYLLVMIEIKIVFSWLFG